MALFNRVNHITLKAIPLGNPLGYLLIREIYLLISRFTLYTLLVLRLLIKAL